jgi:hypothetical protein
LLQGSQTAENHHPPTEKMDSSSSTVYSTTTKEKNESKSSKKNNNKIKNNNNKKKKVKDSESCSSEGESDGSQRGYKCWLCDKPHHLKECPFLDECRDFIKKKLSATAMHTRDHHHYSQRFGDNFFEDDDDQEAHLLYLCRAKPSPPAATIVDDRCSSSLQPTNCVINNGKKKNMDVLLDSQASVSIFSEATLLTSIREAPTAIIVEGIAGDMIVNQIGDHPDFGTIFFHPAAPANLLCQFDMVRNNGCFITLEAESHRYTLKSKSGRIYVFEEKNKLSICKCPPASVYGKPSPIFVNMDQSEKENVFNLMSPFSVAVSQTAENFPQSPEKNPLVQNGGDEKVLKVIDAPVITQDVDDSGWTVVKSKSSSSKAKKFSAESMAKKQPAVTKPKDRISLKKIVPIGAPQTSR